MEPSLMDSSSDDLRPSITLDKGGAGSSPQTLLGGAYSAPLDPLAGLRGPTSTGREG